MSKLVLPLYTNSSFLRLLEYPLPAPLPPVVSEALVPGTQGSSAAPPHLLEGDVGGDLSSSWEWGSGSWS